MKIKTFWDIPREEFDENAKEFKEKYNADIVTTKPFRCVEEYRGYYTRKDGKPCTQEDLIFAYSAVYFGQITDLKLEDGKIKAYGQWDHGD